MYVYISVNPVDVHVNVVTVQCSVPALSFILSPTNKYTAKKLTRQHVDDDDVDRCDDKETFILVITFIKR